MVCSTNLNCYLLLLLVLVLFEIGFLHNFLEAQILHIISICICCLNEFFVTLWQFESIYARINANHTFLAAENDRKNCSNFYFWQTIFEHQNKTNKRTKMMEIKKREKKRRKKHFQLCKHGVCTISEIDSNEHENFIVEYVSLCMCVSD